MPLGVYKRTKEHNRKISEALMGKKLSPEHAQKNREHGFKKGENGWLGRKHRAESREKMRYSAIGKHDGEKNPAWKGGVKRMKGYHTVYARRYVLRKLKTIGEHSFADWQLLKKQYGYRCPSCLRIEPEIKLTQDHIIAVSKGGSDFIENIQPLCMSCNSKKWAKDVPKYPIPNPAR